MVKLYGMIPGVAGLGLICNWDEVDEAHRPGAGSLT